MQANNSLRLPIEAREELAAISPTARDALGLLMERAVNCMTKRMLDIPLDLADAREKEIIYSKLRIEGADRLRRDVFAFFKVLSKIDEDD